MSEPGHHNVCELIGEVEDFCRGPSGHIRGVLVHVDTGQAALVPVLAEALPRLQRGQRIAARGTLQSEPIGQRYPLVYLWARTIEVLPIRRAKAVAGGGSVTVNEDL
jgi:hypothetical protein